MARSERREFSGAELTGAYLPDVLEAQACALRGEHGKALAAMQRAREALRRISGHDPQGASGSRSPDGSETRSDRLHREALLALADAFIVKQRLLLKSGSEPSWEEAHGKSADEEIREALALRGRRPEAFAGSYEPVEAGPDVCAFGRGGEVLVAVPLRPGATKDAVDAGGARDLLDGLPVGLWERAS